MCRIIIVGDDLNFISKWCLICKWRKKKKKNSFFFSYTLVHIVQGLTVCIIFIPIRSQGNSLKWLFFRLYFNMITLKRFSLVCHLARRQYPICKFPFHNVSCNKFLLLFTRTIIEFIRCAYECIWSNSFVCVTKAKNQVERKRNNGSNIEWMKERKEKETPHIYESREKKITFTRNRERVFMRLEMLVVFFFSLYFASNMHNC